MAVEGRVWLTVLQRPVHRGLHTEQARVERTSKLSSPDLHPALTRRLATGVRHAGLPVHDDVMSHPTAGWQAVQCEDLRLTRVRGVKFAGEALGFSNLGGGHQACNSVALPDSRVASPTGQS